MNKMMRVVDAWNQMEAISREADRLSAYLDEIWLTPHEEHTVWIACRVCNSSVKIIFEAFMAVLSGLVESSGEPSVGDIVDWQGLLMLRLVNDYPGCRGAILSKDTFRVLKAVRQYVRFELPADEFATDVNASVEAALDCLAAVRALTRDISRLVENEVVE